MKGLFHTIGLAYLDQKEVEDSFVFDIMPDTPSEIAARSRDYLLSTYVSSDSKFPPELGVSTPENLRRTNNAAEAFHSQFNAQLYSMHPNIYG